MLSFADIAFLALVIHRENMADPDYAKEHGITMGDLGYDGEDGLEVVCFDLNDLISDDEVSDA